MRARFSFHFGCTKLNFWKLAPTAVEIRNRRLRWYIRMLGAQNCQVINTSAEQFTESATGPYDIIFLDPPYEKPELLEHVLGKLCEHAMIKDYVYFEALNEDMLLELCGRFNLAPQRTTHAGATQA